MTKTMKMTITTRINVKVLEQRRVSPPPSSVPNTSLPLSFFDVFWLPMVPIQRLFFYTLSSFPSHPHCSLLPNLKHSLSLALQLFFPLAGSISSSPETGEPEIRYTNGDSVPFTVAESYSDFHHLASDDPKPITDLHPLIPDLFGADPSDLFSLQVTFFPNAGGICIGFCIRHVGDGSSSTQFMKSWASICRAGGANWASLAPLPVHNRALIPDPNGLKNLFLDQLENYKGLDATYLGSLDQVDAVRATFTLGQAQIDALKKRVLAHQVNSRIKPTNLSTYTLVCAYVWACKVQARDKRGSGSAPKTEWFGFRSGWKARLTPPIPDTYFGNCIWLNMVEAESGDFVAAVEAIALEIQRLQEGRLKGAETIIPQLSSLAKNSGIVSTQGSPKLRVYDVDFGWGRPMKIEMISIERTGAMSLAERRDGDDGLEVGLALPKPEMDRFVSLFEDGLASVSLNS